MGRNLPLIFIRLGVIACACAMLFLCVRAAHAQTANDDRYGFIPVPGVVIPPSTQPPQQPAMQQPPMAAPTMPMQQQALAPAGYGTAPAGYAPVPQGPVTAPPMPAGPMPVYGQNYAPATLAQPSSQPYGMASLRGDQTVGPVAQNQGGYYAPATARYGTQMAADPNAYYAASSNGQGAMGGYLLGPGDKLHITVYDETDLSGPYEIDGTGMVRMPLIGTLRAAGNTAAALESSIAGALSQGFLKNPRVNVEITEYRPFYIIGAVNKPGNYPYVNNMTTLDAVALGGGFLDSAKQSVIYVRHEGSTNETVMPVDKMTRIWPGDVVRVKTTVFWDAMAIFTPLAGPAALAATALH